MSIVGSMRSVAPLLVCLAVLVAGCSSSVSGSSIDNVTPDASGDGGTQGETTTTTLTAAVSLTIRLSPDDALFLTKAQEALIAECMADRGFLYQVPPISQADLVPPPVRWTPVYPERAATEGYGINPHTGPEDVDVPIGDASGVDPNAAHLQTLSPDQVQLWIDALSGTEQNRLSVPGAGEGDTVAFMHTDGCVAEVDLALYGDLAGLLQMDQLMAQLTSDQYEYLESDPRILDASEAWIRCMRTEGYDVVNLADGYYIAEQAHVDLPAEQAFAVEVAIATTDARCLDESRLNEVVRTVFDEAQADIIESNAGVIEGIRELQTAAVERAKELLKGS